MSYDSPSQAIRALDRDHASWFSESGRVLSAEDELLAAVCLEIASWHRSEHWLCAHNNELGISMQGGNVLYLIERRMLFAGWSDEP